ncbi:MAG TPA: hypothetical protein VF221_01415, partial [Chloroflexota bacterium]
YGADHEPMLKLHPGATDRTLGIVSVGFGIAACAAMAVAFLVVLVGSFFLHSGHMPFLLLVTPAVLVLASPVFAVAAVVTAVASRRLNPQQSLGRVGLILGRCACGLTIFLAAVMVVTWLAIPTR